MWELIFIYYLKKYYWTLSQLKRGYSLLFKSQLDLRNVRVLSI